MLLDMAEKSAVVPEATALQWNQKAKAYLIARPDRWDAVGRVVEWIEAHEGIVTETDRDAYKEVLADFLVDEIDYLMYDEEDPETIGSFLAALQNLVDTFGFDFSSQMDALDERAGELSYDAHEAEEEYRWTTREEREAHADIEAMFDSLRE